jgi:hypothetical protein
MTDTVEALLAKAGILDSKYHRWLIDARDLRNIGDYGVGSQVPKKYAETICDWAAQLISAAKILLH